MKQTQNAAHSTAGERFDLTAAERRCLELQLLAARRLRARASRLEYRACLEARAFVVQRLKLPEDVRVRLVTKDSIPVAFEEDRLGKTRQGARESSQTAPPPTLGS